MNLGSDLVRTYLKGLLVASMKAYKNEWHVHFSSVPSREKAT